MAAGAVIQQMNIDGRGDYGHYDHPLHYHRRKTQEEEVSQLTREQQILYYGRKNFNFAFQYLKDYIKKHGATEELLFAEENASSEEYTCGIHQGFVENKSEMVIGFKLIFQENEDATTQLDVDSLETRKSYTIKSVDDSVYFDSLAEIGNRLLTANAILNLYEKTMVRKKDNGCDIFVEKPEQGQTHSFNIKFTNNNEIFATVAYVGIYEKGKIPESDEQSELSSSFDAGTIEQFVNYIRNVCGFKPIESRWSDLEHRMQDIIFKFL